ncbi:CHAT domain-containing protein, partial [bacterium]
LHYAGHGVASGRDGWESLLPLAGGTHMSISAILALPAVPRAVVLSACDGAGAASGEGAAPGPGLGLAHAFLAAGAHRVVAAMRPVADATAATVLGGLYEDGRAAEDFAAALRRSELALRASDPEADWSAFRVLRR